ncbi:MAG: VanZ family protein [Betaproteobacteria bacterium]|nr:VanZ family protein [Betaproteobacteria bacterium]
MSFRQNNIRSKDIAFTIIVAVAIGLLAALVVFAGLPSSTKFMHVLHKTGHPLAFGLIALLVLTLLTKRKGLLARPAWIRYLAAFIAAVVVGAVTEIGQLFTHRGASVVDVMYDAVGAIACLAGHAGILGGRIVPKPLGLWLGLLSVALLATAVALGPLIWCLAAYAERDARFPIMMQNPSALGMFFVSSDAGNVSITRLPGIGEGGGAQQNDVNEAPVLKVAIDKGRYPGLQITEPFPKWSGYQALAVDIINPGESEMELVIRVHDRPHNFEYDDRFNRSIIIGARTRTTIMVPLQELQHGPKRRLLNLDAIANLAIFALHPVPNGAFYVSKIWLR